MIRGQLLAITAALVVLIVGAPQGRAQLFGSPCYSADPIFGASPCGSVEGQWFQWIRQADQLVQETITAVREDLNTLLLPAGLFQDATAIVGQLTAFAQQADLLINNPLAFIGNLTAPYYPIPPNGVQELIMHQNAVGGAIQTLGQVIDTQIPTLAAAADVLNSLQGETFGNLGRHMTLQDIAQVDAAHAQQQAALQAIHMAEMQAHHTVMLAQYDRQAMADAWADQAATIYTPYPMTGVSY